MEPLDIRTEGPSILELRKGVRLREPRPCWAQQACLDWGDTDPPLQVLGTSVSPLSRLCVDQEAWRDCPRFEGMCHLANCVPVPFPRAARPSVPSSGPLRALPGIFVNRWF